MRTNHPLKSCRRLLAIVALIASAPTFALTLDAQIDTNEIAEGERTRLELFVAGQNQDPGGSVLLTTTIPAGVAPFSFEALGALGGSLAFTSACDAVGQPFVCEPGDQLAWSFTLADSTDFRRYAVPVSLAPGLASETSITWTVVAELDGTPAAQTTATLQSVDARLIDVSLQPAAAGNGLFDYTLLYGNRSGLDLAQANLTVALAPDVSLVSASGEPTTTPTQVVWNLGTLASGTVGSVSFRLARSASEFPGLFAVPASLSGVLGATPVSATTTETTLFGEGPKVEFELVVNPGPATVGESVDVILHMAYPQSAPTLAPVQAWLQFPAQLEPVDKTRIRGVLPEESCHQVGDPNLCEAGDVLTIAPFVDNPNRYGVVSFGATIAVDAVPGSLLDWVAVAGTGQDAPAWREVAMGVDGRELPALAVDAATTDLFPGQGVNYVVHVGNPTSVWFDGFDLIARLADQAEFVAADGFHLVQNNEVTWPSVFLTSSQTTAHRLTLRTHPNSDGDDLVPTEFRYSGDLNGTPVSRSVRVIASRQQGLFFDRGLAIDQQPVQSEQTARVRLADTAGAYNVEDADLFVRLPAGIAPFDLAQVIGPVNRDMSCRGGFEPDTCEGGEQLVYDLPQGFSEPEVDVVSFPVRAGPDAFSGGFLRLEQLVQASSQRPPIFREQRTIRIDDIADVELLVEQSADPVVGLIGPTYTVLYANAGQQIATDGELTVRVPAFLQIEEASGNGTIDPFDNTVSWSLPPLEPGQIGRTRIRTVAFDDDFGVPLNLDANLLFPFGPFGQIPLAAQNATSTSQDGLFSLAVHVSKNRAVTFDDPLTVTVELANPSAQPLDPGTLSLRVPQGPQGILEERILGRGFNADQSCEPDDRDVCEANERIVWEPGIVAPGEVLRFSFSALAFDPDVQIANLVPVEAIATGFAARDRRAERIVRYDDSGLSLSVDVDGAPQAPGAPVRAVIHYAIDGTGATDGVFLVAPLAPDLEFVSASPLGFFDPATREVQWPLDSSAAGTVGRRELVVRTATDAAPGTLANIRADLEVNVFGASRESASQSARVGVPATLAADVIFDPPIAAPGAPVRMEISVTNTSDVTQSDSDVLLRYPQGLEPLQASDISGPLSPESCAFSGASVCEFGELLIFDLDPLLPGDTVTLSIDTAVESFSRNGGLLPVAVRATADADDEIWLNRTLAISMLPDTDNDGVLDDTDNCLNVPNSSQRDTDEDLFGNACDADLNNDCVINVVDLGLLRSVFFSADPDADFDGDGVVNVVDLGILRSAFFGAPGPSGWLPTCTASPLPR